MKVITNFQDMKGGVHASALAALAADIAIITGTNTGIAEKVITNIAQIEEAFASYREITGENVVSIGKAKRK